MLIAALLLMIVTLIGLTVFQLHKKRKQETFRRLLQDARVEGQWAEVITRAHQTMPADEVQKLEQAIYLHAHGSMDINVSQATQRGERAELA